ncbi:hypothetical protein QFZ75_006333 [Streptomyces sp. V3I8]|uniref:hypothetical protein n=1 Tax=Streptomyces sp. V3I8 TaxID=3042279 RepID=UPI0027831888|nr:hypothetical protein [Streptomyces sp. V3I8]MDQ1039917.1 hypothetical protein [Streptomyces sp. V3I8]
MRYQPLIIRSALLPSHPLGSPTPRRPARRGHRDYQLGHPGRPAKAPTLLITVFDNSGSVVSPAGTDPLSNRFAEVAHAFSVVAIKGSRHELAMVLHFDTPSSGEVGPLPITRRSLARLRPGLRVPADGAGSSELGPSLRRANDVAESHPDHAVTLVVLSDFALLDPDPTQVLSDLSAFPGQVHAVVLGARSTAGGLDKHITTTCIQLDSRPGAVARALFASLVAHRPGSHVATET